MNGSLGQALKQLDGIGSSLTVPTKDGRIMSLADGLAHALHRYLAAKREYGLEALLLGRIPSGGLENTPANPAAVPARHATVSRYKLKCPSCTAVLAFEEGCAKCYDCGFSQC